MTNESTVSPSRKVPIAVFVAFLAAYLVTMNRWVNFASVHALAQSAGWEWRPLLVAPFMVLLEKAASLIPLSSRILAMNVFTVVAASLTLALLARSVTLLPGDRTKEQRSRIGAKGSEPLLVSWLPGIVAACICGFQLTFWDNATNFTGEVLDLLVFAYAIRGLLEFRISGKHSWLYKAAFVYGLGMANNWSLIGFLPLFFIAIVWIKGLDFFHFQFLVRLFGYGLLGLLMYLAIPLINLHHPTYSFFEILKFNAGSQRTYLFNIPRWLPLLFSVFSIIPIFLMAIKWPSISDSSAMATALSKVLFRLIHVFFLALGIWVAFDYKFSPRTIDPGTGLGFLTFYYLGALSVGYYLKYCLVVFGLEAHETWEREKGMVRALTKTIYFLVLALAVIAPVALVLRTWPAIKIANGSSLKNMADLMKSELPAKPAAILSDDPTRLYLVQAAYAAEGSTNPHFFLDTTSLPLMDYYKRLGTTHPLLAPTLLKMQEKAMGVDTLSLIQWLVTVKKSFEIYYLHPSFGYYFEKFQMRPRGLVYELEEYPANELMGAPLSPEEIKENMAVWRGPLVQNIQTLKAPPETHIAVELIKRGLSRSCNFFGVELQKQNMLKEAAEIFKTSLDLNPENYSAVINAEFNKILANGAPRSIELTPEISKKLSNINFEDSLNVNGPYDELNYTYRLGEVFGTFGNLRQGAQQFQRIVSLVPTNVPARLNLAKLYIDMRFNAKATELTEQLKKSPENRKDSPLQYELLNVEALNYLASNQFEKGEKLMVSTAEQNPKNPVLQSMLTQWYLTTGRTTNAMLNVEQELRANPKNTKALLTKAGLLMMWRKFDQALPMFDTILTLQPDLQSAMQDKAITLFQLGKYAEAKSVYEDLKMKAPENYAVYYGLGEIAYKDHDRKAALASYANYFKFAPPGTAESKIVQEHMTNAKKNQWN